MSSKQSIDRNGRVIKHSNTEQPKLINTPERSQQSATKPTGPRLHEIEMGDMAAHSSETEKDSRILIVNNQADKKLPKDDDELLPNQDAVVNEVRSPNKLVTFRLINIIKHVMSKNSINIARLRLYG